MSYYYFIRFASGVSSRAGWLSGPQPTMSFEAGFQHAAPLITSFQAQHYRSLFSGVHFTIGKDGADATPLTGAPADSPAQSPALPGAGSPSARD
jgi:hypothetical protein